MQNCVYHDNKPVDEHQCFVYKAYWLDLLESKEAKLAEAMLKRCEKCRENNVSTRENA